MGRLIEEIGDEKEYSENGSWPEYFQFILIIRQPLFLIWILKTKVGRSEFSFCQVSAPEISGKCQNKERNCYHQKKSDPLESFFHVLESMLFRLQ